MDSVLNRLRGIDLGKIPGDQLLVPLNRDFLEWQSSSTARPETHTTEGITENNQILKSYLSVRNIKKLSPDTKIPLGILILCYNMYLPNNGSPTLQSLKEVRHAPITSRFPFGILLGADIRQAVLEPVGQD